MAQIEYAYSGEDLTAGALGYIVVQTRCCGVV